MQWRDQDQQCRQLYRTENLVSHTTQATSFSGRKAGLSPTTFIAGYNFTGGPKQAQECDLVRVYRVSALCKNRAILNWYESEALPDESN
jgi:hypothetical protein